ncbi:MAG TPA: hypothetical protein DCW68_00380 [Rhodospirillaceae bacterium]|nr:MAG: hypothetical protein A2018_01695 [Alphaproteobacteria bacterium GWF2_58_20]HAU28557.1 hypothetical protein [Rhodospirillaceae bacterium]
MLILHGTCIDIDGAAVLLRGESGSGKSDLALRLIEDGARLIADDQTCFIRQDTQLLASPPDSIQGLLEVRGVGIVRVPFSRKVPLRLVVDLLPDAGIERMPEKTAVILMDLHFPSVSLPAFHAASAAKVRMALACSLHPDMVSS